MKFDDMVKVGPVHIHWFENREFRAVWTPLGPKREIELHGIGLGDTPYMAAARAYRDAVDKGWKPPERGSGFIPNNY